MTLKELFQNIADTIRMRNPYAEPKIKATDFPSAINLACDESEAIGYNIGLEEGKESMIDRDKVIPKKANGNPVVIDDASEIPHTVGVKALSNKNLIPYPYANGGTTVAGVTWTINDDRSITASGTTTSWSGFTPCEFSCEEFKDKIITISKIGETKNINIEVRLRDGLTIIKTFSASQAITIDLSQYPTVDSILVSFGTTREPSGTFFVQAEIGSTTTEYVPYKAPVSNVVVELAENGKTYTTNINGEFECDSLSPYMTFNCDDTVKIEVDYWKSYGMQTEYDRFWDRYQENGNRQNYYMAFNSTNTSAWWYDNFKPKYDFKIIQAQYMFYGFGTLINEPFDLKQHLDNLGIGFDTTECQSFMQTFINSTISHIPYLDCTSTMGDRLVDTFRTCKHLETIDGMKVKAETPFTNTFLYCYKLKNISFDGVIGQNISFHTSPLLTVESLRSILTALSKDSTYASGKTVTFNTASQAVIEADSECSTQLASAVAAGWTVAYNS